MLSTIYPGISTGVPLFTASEFDIHIIASSSFSFISIFTPAIFSSIVFSHTPCPDGASLSNLNFKIFPSIYTGGYCPHNIIASLAISSSPNISIICLPSLPFISSFILLPSASYDFFINSFDGSDVNITTDTLAYFPLLFSFNNSLNFISVILINLYCGLSFVQTLTLKYISAAFAPNSTFIFSNSLSDTSKKLNVFKASWYSFDVICPAVSLSFKSFKHFNHLFLSTEEPAPPFNCIFKKFIFFALFEYFSSKMLPNLTLPSF